MSPGLRAFYGALVGAFAVLLLHPISRPHFVQGFGLTSTTILAVERTVHPRGVEPTLSMIDRSRIVRGGLSKAMTAQSSRSELLNLLAHATSGSKQDPDNAFWRQSEAVFRSALGDSDGAYNVMRTASFATKWNDYAVDAIKEDIRTVDPSQDHGLAWYSALSESLKNSRCELAIVGMARGMARETDELDIDRRISIFRNAKLIRDGSRSVEGSLMGLELMELIAF